MGLEYKTQDRLLKMLCEDFAEVKRCTPKAFEGWVFTKDFDRHSPCRNLMIQTPNGSEIKIFVPNANITNHYQEEFSEWSVWFNVYGMGEDDEPMEFDLIVEMVDYLLDQWDSNNL